MGAVRGLLVLGVLASAAEAGGPAPATVSEARFLSGGVEYRIRAEKFAATSRDRCPAIRIAYRVWRDGAILHPEDPEGGRRVAPVLQMEQPEPLDLAPFPDAGAPVGWSIRCGYGSGNPSHDLAIVVLPRKDAYREVVWVWKSFCGWTLRKDAGRVELWTCVQDEGVGIGTAGQVFVPERRVLSVARDGASLDLAPLDPDWTRWPGPCARPGFGGAFVAGLRQENPSLLRAALSLWSPDLASWADDFGLPHDAGGLRRLADAVQEVVDAKARAHALCGFLPRPPSAPR